MRAGTVVPVIAILLISSFPLEAKKNIRPFFLRITATMNGVEIPSGIYDISWESEKPGVRVTLWKNGQFFATAKGEWVKHGQKYTDDAAVLRVNSDGSRSLVEIRIAGDKRTIVLGFVEPTSSFTQVECNGKLAFANHVIFEAWGGPGNCSNHRETSCQERAIFILFAASGLRAGEFIWSRSETPYRQ